MEFFKDFLTFPDILYILRLLSSFSRPYHMHFCSQLLLLLLLYTLRGFYISFNCSLSDSQFHQVFRTLLSILADIKSAVVFIVSISFGHLPFVNIAKFYSLAQFSRNHLSYSVILTHEFFYSSFPHSLIRSLLHICLFITYTCYSVAYNQF